MKIAFEFDDFSPKNTSFGLLEDIREHYPKFKVSMFTVPMDIQTGELTPITVAQWQPFVDAVKRSTDWIQIAVHGLTHAPMEFAEISYDEAKKRLIVAEKMFINRGITISKIFKAPMWALSEQGEQAALDLGYTVVKDYYYHWNLADEIPTEVPADKIIIAHGHIQNVMGNGVEESLQKILKLPPETEFFFLSDALAQDTENKYVSRPKSI